jgi:hypothetical protein
MSAWQYAQLTVRLEGCGGEDSCTILWHGPGQGLGENFSGSGQTVLELMNRVGADGWELAGLEARREGGDGRTYWDAAWSLTTYTFSASYPVGWRGVRSWSPCRLSLVVRTNTSPMVIFAMPGSYRPVFSVAAGIAGCKRTILRRPGRGRRSAGGAGRTRGGCW